MTAAEARKKSDKNKNVRLIEELENLQVSILNQISRGSYYLYRADISEEARTILIEHGYTIGIAEIQLPNVSIVISWDE